MNNEPVTPETLIIDVLEMHPKTKDVFLKYGLPCHTCWVAEVESIETGARSEGLDADEIVRDINELLGR